MKTRLVVLIVLLLPVPPIVAAVTAKTERVSKKDDKPLTILVMLKKKKHPFVNYVKERYRVKLFFAQPEKGAGIPGVGAVDKCDVILLSQRRQHTTPEQTAVLKKSLLKDRKPIAGIRQTVQFTPKGKKNPLLAGFKPFMCNGYPYTYKEIASDVEVLVNGGLPGDMQPIVWTRVTKDGQRIFYTRCDERDLVKSEDCRKVLARALFWVTGKDASAYRKVHKKKKGRRCHADHHDWAK